MSMLRDHDFQIRVAPLPVAGFFLIFLFSFLKWIAQFFCKNLARGPETAFDGAVRPGRD